MLRIEVMAAKTHKETLSTLVVKWKTKGLKKPEALDKAKAKVKKLGKRWTLGVQETFDKAWKTRITPQMQNEKDPKKLIKAIKKEKEKTVPKPAGPQFYLYLVSMDTGGDEPRKSWWVCAKPITDFDKLRKQLEDSYSNLDIYNSNASLQKVGPASAFKGLSDAAYHKIQDRGAAFNYGLWNNTYLDFNQLQNP